MSIRFARKADCAAIAEIYNHAVLYTAAIWNDQTVDADNRIAWFEARTLAGYPVLVSEENGVVTGYASFGDWRSFDGFRHTVGWCLAHIRQYLIAVADKRRRIARSTHGPSFSSVGKTKGAIRMFKYNVRGENIEVTDD